MKNLYDVAIQHLERGELDVAEDAFRTYLKENPTDAKGIINWELFSSRGLILRRLNGVLKRH